MICISLANGSLCCGNQINPFFKTVLTHFYNYHHCPCFFFFAPLKYNSKYMSVKAFQLICCKETDVKDA